MIDNKYDETYSINYCKIEDSFNNLSDDKLDKAEQMIKFMNN